ncbi:hypothetical protein B0H16DRAFT_1638040 [Mycena metata]|uniref:F-box domain-containing protein n=1 Tax=Mycena metata TaxID=1033252 RepID=A0AAD7M738_9AGAR|nr:hypothetical protein B0H16DRAFT_1638040 [Mycena metata]
MAFQREGASSSVVRQPGKKLCADRELEPFFNSSVSSSLVLRLPPEITSEIFLHFLPTYPEFPPLSGILSPVLLCQICGHWREIALSTPRLWRAIKLPLDSHQGVLPLLDCLTAWLARSGRSPLALEITAVSTSELEFLPDFMPTIALHRHRLDHLVLDVRFEHLSFLSGDMPLLRDLTIGSTYHAPPAGGSILIDHAPALRNLVVPVFDVAFRQLPFGQLISLDAGYIYLTECAEILREAKNLVDCRFTIQHDTFTPTSIPIIPAHQRLRHIAFRRVDGTHIDRLLAELTLPVLSKLEVYESGVSIAALAAFISRSQCTLEELRITYARSEEEAYHQALPSVSAIILERGAGYSFYGTTL